MRKLLITLLFTFISIVQSNSLSENNNLDNQIEQYNTFIEHVENNINNNSISFSDNMPLYSPLNADSIERISDFFGIRHIHPILKIKTFHKGIDIVGTFDSPVYSTAYGIVEKVEYSNRGYGNNILINHGDKYKTRYAHLNKILVKEGDFINVKDQIGTLGSSGLSTGPHLHYEILYDNKPIDPISFYTDSLTKDKQNVYLSYLITLDKWYNDKDAITW